MKKILLIDDEELVTRSLGKLFSKFNYDVVVCKTAEDGINKANEVDFDLIITDIRMPGLNGLDGILEIRKIRKKRGLKDIREIIMTGYAEDGIEAKAKEIGVAEYIYKPFDVRVLLSCVEKNMQEVS